MKSKLRFGKRVEVRPTHDAEPIRGTIRSLHVADRPSGSGPMDYYIVEFDNGYVGVVPYSKLRVLGQIESCKGKEG